MSRLIVPLVLMLVSCSAADRQVTSGGPYASPSDGGVVDAGPRSTCSDMLLCNRPCPNDAGSCPNQCEASASTQSRALYQAAVDCMDQYCEAQHDGAPCGGEVDCNQCRQDAIGGECEPQLRACFDDMGALADGGAP